MALAKLPYIIIYRSFYQLKTSIYSGFKKLQCLFIGGYIPQTSHSIPWSSHNRPWILNKHVPLNPINIPQLPSFGTFMWYMMVYSYFSHILLVYDAICSNMFFIYTTNNPNTNHVKSHSYTMNIPYSAKFMSHEIPWSSHNRPWILNKHVPLNPINIPQLPSFGTFMWYMMVYSYFSHILLV